jgi:hypothetical protein
MVIGLTLCLFTFPTVVVRASSSYYVSSSSGNYNNPGTISQPWKTLAKVSGITFQPGDGILFKQETHGVKLKI